jgi:hypothetical protein
MIYDLEDEKERGSAGRFRLSVVSFGECGFGCGRRRRRVLRVSLVCNCAKQTQSARPIGRRRRACCTNKPNPAGRSCQTNPISGGGNIPPFHYSIIPPCQPGGYRAKQTQFRPPAKAPMARRAKQTQLESRSRQTNPILAIMPIRRSAFPGGPLCDIASMPRFGKQSQFHRSVRAVEGERCETNPICRGDRAKRSQFPGADWVQSCAGTSCTNKPNSSHAG